MSNPSSKPFDKLDYTYKILVILTIITVAVYLASDILIPLVFAGFLSVVMLPIIRKLESWKIGSTLSITIVLIVSFALLGLAVWLTIDQIVGLINDLPNLQSKFERYINNLSLTLQNEFGITTTDQTSMLGELAKSGSSYVGSILISTTNTLSTLIQIPIYVFLFLIYRDKFEAFFIQLLPGSENLTWTQEVEHVLQGYISGLFLVTVIVAFLNSVGLLIVGIDHAIFFGVLSGVLTVIPYVGIIIGSLLPIIMALITKDSIWYTIGVVIVFSIVQFLEGNFITPRVTGSKVSINALAAIIALLIGGKILGIAGMILAIPALGTVKILLSYSKHLKPFVILLEDEPLVREVKLEEKAAEAIEVKGEEGDQ